MAWLVYGLAALAFGYAFFQRVAPSAMVSDLMTDFAIGGGTLGVLSALYFYPYVVLQVPLGALLDRVGARKLLVLSLSLAGAGSLLFGLTSHIELAYLGRVMIGAGSAVGFLGSLALAANWFPQNRFAMLAGCTLFAGMICGMVAQGPLALFVEAYGWRAAQSGLGGFALLLALLIFLIVRNAPPGMKIEDKPLQSWGEVMTSIGQALRHKTVWMVALPAAALSAPMLTLGGLWATPFLKTSYGLSQSDAAFLASLTLFGWAIAAPVSGWLSDYFNRRRILLLIGLVSAILVLGLLILLPGLPLWLTVTLLCLCGIAGGMMVVSMALVRELVPQPISGAALGIVNGSTVASGALFQPGVGYVLDLLWDGKMADGVRIYQPDDYRTAFMLILAFAVVGLICVLRLRDKP